MFWLPNIADPIKEFVWWLWDAIQQLLALPITFMNLPVAEYFLGNSAGLAIKLVVYVFVASLLVAIFIRRKRKDAAISFLNVIFAVAVIPVWFAAAQMFLSFGDTLKSLALEMGKMPTPTENSNDLGNITMPFASVDQITVTIFFALLLAGSGLQVLMLVITYQLANVVIVSLGLIVYALSGIGENTRKFFSLLISIFLVTGILGIPVILFLTQLSQLIGDWLFKDNPTGSIILLFVGATFGFVMQFVIVIYAYKQVDRVVGSVVARINDKVRSVTENSQRLEAHLAGSEKTTMSYRFRQMTANTVNSQLDKIDAWKSNKVALITKKISDASAAYKARGQGETPSVDGRELSPTASTASNTVSTVGATVTAVVPHPAAKVLVGIGSAALTGLIQKVGSRPAPRVGVTNYENGSLRRG